MKQYRGILPYHNLILDSFLDVVEEDTRAMRQHGRITRVLQMLNSPLVVQPLLLDALAPEVDLNAFTVELRLLMRLHLERWYGFTLGEVLLNRVEQHTSSAWAALLRRCRRDVVLHNQQHIALPHGFLNEAQLDGQRMPIPHLILAGTALKLSVEDLEQVVDVYQLPGLLSPPPCYLAVLCICHLCYN